MQKQAKNKTEIGPGFLFTIPFDDTYTVYMNTRVDRKAIQKAVEEGRIFGLQISITETKSGLPRVSLQVVATDGW